MPAGKKDGAAGAGSAARGQNGEHFSPTVSDIFADFSRLPGNRSAFRTDAAISNSRFGNERVLQPWVPDTNNAFDASLEKSANSAPWDQFAENERLFGLKTDYDENMYTTTIDKSHPQHRERIVAADKKAREIERSAAATSHVAEERMMDYVAGGENDGDNEEDK